MQQSSTSTTSISSSVTKIQQVVRDVYYHDDLINHISVLNNSKRKKEGTTSSSVLLPIDYKPTKFDICSGRGKQHWFHPGNVAFRQLIQGMVHSYISEINKSDKTAFVLNVVEEMKKVGCRFLKQNENGNWYEIDVLGARDKVAHALRDQVTAIRKEENKQQLHNSNTYNNNSNDIYNDVVVPPPPPLERTNSLVSDSGNEADVRRESLHSTTLHHQFARRPSWIAGESSTSTLGGASGPNNNNNNNQHYNDTIMMMPTEQLPVAVTYENERRASSWGFFNNQYYGRNNILISSANYNEHHHHPQYYYPIQTADNRYYFYHHPHHQHHSMKVDNNAMYHTGQQQKQHHEQDQYPHPQQQQHGSIPVQPSEQYDSSMGSAGIEETTLKTQQSDILKDHEFSTTSNKEDYQQQQLQINDHNDHTNLMFGVDNNTMHHSGQQQQHHQQDQYPHPKQQQQHGSIQPSERLCPSEQDSACIEETTIDTLLQDHTISPSPTKTNEDIDQDHADMMCSSIKGWDPRRSSGLSSFSSTVGRSIFLKDADDSFSSSMNFNFDSKPSNNNSSSTKNNSTQQSITSTTRRSSSRMSDSNAIYHSRQDQYPHPQQQQQQQHGSIQLSEHVETTALGTKSPQQSTDRLRNRARTE